MFELIFINFYPGQFSAAIYRVGRTVTEKNLRIIRRVVFLKE